MNSGIGIAFLPGNPKHFGAFTYASKTKKITDGCIRQPPVKNSALRNQKL